MLEKVFRTENGHITIGKPAEKAGLSKTIGINLKTFNAILATALEVECFVLEGETLTSPGIQKRFSLITGIREKERKRKEEYKNRIKYKYKYKEKEKTRRGKPPENPPPSVEKIQFLDFVFLTPNEHKKLVEQFGEKGTQERIEDLNNYGHQKAKKFKEYTSHYHTILKWEKKNKDGGNHGNSRTGNKLDTEPGKYDNVGTTIES